MSYRTDVMGHLIDEQWEIFCNQYRNSYKREQKRLNTARATRQACEDQIASSLKYINSIKEFVKDKGINLDE